MKRIPRRIFTEDFKLEAIKLITQQGLTVAEVGKKLDVATKSLRTSFSAMLACLNNSGPGLGQVGPAGNYQGMNGFQSRVCIFAMLVGRLEIFTVLILFTPRVWKH